MAIIKCRSVTIEVIVDQEHLEKLFLSVGGKKQKGRLKAVIQCVFTGYILYVRLSVGNGGPNTKAMASFLKVLTVECPHSTYFSVVYFGFHPHNCIAGLVFFFLLICNIHSRIVFRS